MIASQKGKRTLKNSTISQKKSEVIPQLNRVRGQIEGICSMIEEQRDCLEIVQQILAARSALSSVGRTYLTKEAVRCSRSAGKNDQFESVLKQLFSM